MQNSINRMITIQFLKRVTDKNINKLKQIDGFAYIITTYFKYSTSNYLKKTLSLFLTHFTTYIRLNKVLHREIILLSYALLTI